MALSIVLACAEGTSNKAVASRQRVTEQTVSKWRGRFVEYRLDGLLDAPRCGTPRTIDDARVDAIVGDRSAHCAAGVWMVRKKDLPGKFFMKACASR